MENDDENTERLQLSVICASGEPLPIGELLKRLSLEPLADQGNDPLTSQTLL